MALTDIIYTTRAKLTALYDAIREKAGVTGTMTIDQATEAVESIQSGGDILEKVVNRDGTGGLSNIELDLRSLSAIGTNACYKGAAIVKVDIATGAAVYNNAFYECRSLATVNGDDIVLGYIGGGAFGNCLPLNFKRITATTIESGAFAECRALRKIAIHADAVNGNVFGIAGAASTSNPGIQKAWLSKDIATIQTINYNFAPFKNHSYIEIYTDATEAPSGWGQYFNYTAKDAQVTVHYGVSEEEFWALED